MTKRLPFTKASIRRAIAAAQEAGLRVVAIRPDGTVLVDGNGPASGGHVLDTSIICDDDSKWLDVQV